MHVDVVVMDVARGDEEALSHVIFDQYMRFSVSSFSHRSIEARWNRQKVVTVLLY